MYTNLTRGDRVFCAGVMVMVEKGGGSSFRGELFIPPRARPWPRRARASCSCRRARSRPSRSGARRRRGSFGRGCPTTCSRPRCLCRNKISADATSLLDGVEVQPNSLFDFHTAPCLSEGRPRSLRGESASVPRSTQSRWPRRALCAATPRTCSARPRRLVAASRRARARAVSPQWRLACFAIRASCH